MPQPKIYNTQMREIIQGTNIRLRMNRSRSVQIKELQKLFREEPSRVSVDGSTININLKGLDNTVPKISKPVYKETYNSKSPWYSPTTLQILNTLNREQPFQIDKNWIRQDFEAKYNKEKKGLVFQHL